MSDKNLVERLMKAADRIADNYVYGYEACELSNLAGTVCIARSKNECECQFSCAQRSLKAIADEIERDYIRAPRFINSEQGDTMRRKIAQWFDALATNGAVVNVAFEYDEPVEFNVADVVEWHSTGYGTIKIRFREDEPREDTLESIDGDAASHPRVYCEEHGVEVGDLWNYDECLAAMVRDLLRRQREVLERGK